MNRGVATMITIGSTKRRHGDLGQVCTVVGGTRSQAQTMSVKESERENTKLHRGTCSYGRDLRTDERENKSSKEPKTHAKGGGACGNDSRIKEKNKAAS